MSSVVTRLIFQTRGSVSGDDKKEKKKKKERQRIRGSRMGKEERRRAKSTRGDVDAPFQPLVVSRSRHGDTPIIGQ